MSTLKVTNVQHGSATNVGIVLDSAGTVKTYSTISVGNVAPSSSGAGVTFPATQSASTDANTLDDYEEGTFTPAWTNLTINSGTPTYAGKYTKVGNLVTVNWTITGGANITITANSTYINNLPFTAAADSCGSWLNTSTTNVIYGQQTANATTRLYLATTVTSANSFAGTATYYV